MMRPHREFLDEEAPSCRALFNHPHDYLMLGQKLLDIVIPAFSTEKSKRHHANAMCRQDP